MAKRMYWAGGQAVSSKWETEACALVQEAGFEFRTDKLLYSDYRSNGQANFTAPDLWFEDRRLAVYLDGCYWHGCPECKPGVRQDRYARDRVIEAALIEKGYTVLRIWEHEGPTVAAERVLEALRT